MKTPAPKWAAKLVIHYLLGDMTLSNSIKRVLVTPIGFHVGKKNDGSERILAIPFWLLLIIISVLGILAAIFVPATKGKGPGGM